MVFIIALLIMRLLFHTMLHLNQVSIFDHKYIYFLVMSCLITILGTKTQVMSPNQRKLFNISLIIS